MDILNYRGVVRADMAAVRAASIRSYRPFEAMLAPDARQLYSQLGFTLVRELDAILGQQYWLYTMQLQ
ncbi:hypothetical protein [Chitinophaga sp.]|uniref:hypothetical protein n=1 Tax=Chitinophaga sp. TaxID=1869181 RepID=UPI002F94864B